MAHQCGHSTIIDNLKRHESICCGIFLFQHSFGFTEQKKSVRFSKFLTFHKLMKPNQACLYSYEGFFFMVIPNNGTRLSHFTLKCDFVPSWFSRDKLNSKIQSIFIDLLSTN